MRDLHWTLDSLPPTLRAQAERQLGNDQNPHRVFAVPESSSPAGIKKPRRRGAGLYKAIPSPEYQNASPALPTPSPAGFKSIAEIRAEKKSKKRRKTLTPDMAKTLVKSCEVSPDEDEVRFVLGCSPYMMPTAQEKKIGMIGGKPRLFKVAKVQKAEKTITLAMAPYAHLFKAWGGFPVGVWLDFCYEYPSGTTKKDLIDFRYSQQKNDLDNSAKGVIDSLTKAGLWEDDNRIAELHLRKFRVLTDPRIVITVRKLPQIAVGADLLVERKEWFFKNIVGEEEA